MLVPELKFLNARTDRPDLCSFELVYQYDVSLYKYEHIVSHIQLLKNYEAHEHNDIIN